MRELTSHMVNGCNEAIEIKVLDEPGHGGACHEYLATVYGRPALRNCHESLQPIYRQSGPGSDTPFRS